jgi:hypothetical protein
VTDNKKNMSVFPVKLIDKSSIKKEMIADNTTKIILDMDISSLLSNLINLNI